MTTVSIGIPFLNEERFLAQAITSVLAQTHRDWELVLLDDGSTDRSLDIARSFTDSRISVVTDGRNRGLAARLNQITNQARVDLVTRMDADDVMHPDRLSVQVACMAQDTSLDLCASAAYVIDEQTRIVGVRGMGIPSTDWEDVFASGLVVHPTVMFRRAWALRHPYDESVGRAEDRQLWCAAADTLKFQVIQSALLYYREPSRLRLGPYLRSGEANRRIIRAASRGKLSVFTRNRLLMRSHLADAAHAAAHLLHLDGFLVQRRFAKLPIGMRAAAERDLSAALAPGSRGVA